MAPFSAGVRVAEREVYPWRTLEKPFRLDTQGDARKASSKYTAGSDDVLWRRCGARVRCFLALHASESRLQRVTVAAIMMVLPACLLHPGRPR